MNERSELSILFERDPLNYSDQDLTIIVGEMREWQARQELGPQPKVAKPPRTSKTLDLLKDLGLT